MIQEKSPCFETIIKMNIQVFDYKIGFFRMLNYNCHICEALCKKCFDVKTFTLRQFGAAKIRKMLFFVRYRSR